MPKELYTVVLQREAKRFEEQKVLATCSLEALKKAIKNMKKSEVVKSVDILKGDIKTHFIHNC